MAERLKNGATKLALPNKHARLPPMDFFANYGIFLAKTATIVAAIIVILVVIAALSQKSKSKPKGKLTIKKINEKFEEMAETINEAILTKDEVKEQKKSKKTKSKKTKTKKHPRRVFVIHFNGDIRASAVNALREEVTAILLTAKSHDQVLCCLESPGGLVNAYGLAASQLQRLKDAKLNLTVAVDKVAASGGYMMACVADEIIAAPFSVIGSIGVIAQLPNFHRYLEKKNIDFEQLTAGEYKRTLTMFGKNTAKSRDKMQEEINDTHDLFKTFISQHRENLEIDQVATGEHWYGTQALELKLIDKIQTSDDYILSANNKFDIYQVQYRIKKSFGKRFSDSAQLLLTKFTNTEF